MDRRPTVNKIVESARLHDLRSLGDQNGEPIYFTEVQMKAVRLLAELYFGIQGAKEDLIKNPGTCGYRYFPEIVWKLRCIRINADIANRWIAEDLPDINSPEIEVVLAFLNQRYVEMQYESDRKAHREFAVWSPD